MKLSLLAASVAVALSASLNAVGGELTTDTQKASYAIGLTSAQSITRQGVELDLTAFTAGVKDAIEGNKPQQLICIHSHADPSCATCGWSAWAARCCGWLPRGTTTA